jgi:branched-chain amino acid transport system permease protein
MSGLVKDSVKNLGPWLVLVAVFAAAPLIFSSPSSLTMMSVMGVMIIFALSYNMLLGQTGLLSFGHAVYYGLGGFVALHAMNAIVWIKLHPIIPLIGGIPVPAIPLIGGLAGLFFGFLFGLVSVRRAGIVFAMISLGIGELVSSSSFVLRSFFGGEEGIRTNRTKLAAFLGHKFGDEIEVYYLVAVWCFACIVAMYALTRTPFGQMCNAVRENPERVEFIGYSPRRIRFIAFCFAAFFAGIAGALSAISFEIMNAASLGALQSGLVLLMTFVGGIGYFFGPVIGAILISFLQTKLSDVTGAWQLYFGLLFIHVVLLSPGGIAGWLALHGEAARRGEILRLAPSYGLVAVPIASYVCGVILLIELAHRVLVVARTEGTLMTFFGIGLDAGSLSPWLAALLLLGAGVLFGRSFWPRVEAAWADIHLQRQKRKATA